MFQDKRPVKPDMARIDQQFHPTFVSLSSSTLCVAFVTDSPTLKSWRKQHPVFEQKANPVFVTAEKHFIFSLPPFQVKKCEKK